jgi:hypothetical protein
VRYSGQARTPPERRAGTAAWGAARSHWEHTGNGWATHWADAQSDMGPALGGRWDRLGRTLTGRAGCFLGAARPPLSATARGGAGRLLGEPLGDDDGATPASLSAWSWVQHWGGLDRAGRSLGGGAGTGSWARHSAKSWASC